LIALVVHGKRLVLLFDSGFGSWFDLTSGFDSGFEAIQLPTANNARGDSAMTVIRVIHYVGNEYLCAHHAKMSRPWCERIACGCMFLDATLHMVTG
jgi:hypothetical protein